MSMSISSDVRDIIISALIEWEESGRRFLNACKTAALTTGIAFIGGITMGPIGIAAASTVSGICLGTIDRNDFRNFATTLRRTLSEMDVLSLCETIISAVPLIVSMITSRSATSAIINLVLNITRYFINNLRNSRALNQ